MLSYSGKYNRLCIIIVSFNEVQKKGQNQTIYCLGIHTCDKTTEKSKEIIITKDRIMLPLKKRERVVFRKVSRGNFGVLAMFHFLTWLVTWKFLL